MSAINRTLLTFSGFALIAGASINIYSNITIDKDQENVQEIRRQLFVENRQAIFSVELRKENQLFRMKYPASQGQTTTIFVNGNELRANTWPFRRFKKNFQTDYIFVPERLLRDGRNLIKLSFGSGDSRADAVIRNYRKFLRPGIYVLFCRNSPRSALQFIASILIMLLGMALFLLGQDVITKKNRMFLYRWRYSLSALIILLSAIFGTSRFLGFELKLTPVLFWCSAFLLSATFALMDMLQMPQYAHPVLLKASGFLFTRKRAAFRTYLILALIIITVDLCAYSPSFFHIFRHDEWFLFFSSRNALPNLEFFIKHIDWQLTLPYDRMMFRPFSQSMLALNRVIFDTDYVGPHILTFLKHILTAFCLWWLMWELNPRWISWLFALLFSVLVASADPVMWPLLDAYILTSAFAILAVIIFRKTIHNQIPVTKGFVSVALLLFLNLLTSEIAFPMPFVFFLAYWTIFRDRREPTLRKKDRCIWLVLLVPIVLWAALYSVHLYFAYPDFRMTSQSASIGLWLPITNMARCTLILLSGMAFPMFATTRYLDKVYLAASFAGIILVSASILICIRSRRKMLRRATREVLFSTMLVFSILAVICFSRAAYVNNLLNSSMLPGHYVYCVSALIIFTIYALIDFDKIASSAKSALVLFAIFGFLIVNHALKTNQAALEIGKHTAHLKKYFDSVSDFVLGHKNEPDFSFKIIDRPPKVEAFPWYHETCVDGLFNRFIDNKTPRYVLEYDYPSEELKDSPYEENQPRIVESELLTNVSQEPDYINSLGMQFEKVSRGGYHFLMGIVEVTQKQWKGVMGANPSRSRNDNHPVENVSYDMIQEFVRHLNKTEGDGFYRLPTVEEYSYLVNISPLSEAPSNIKEHAWLKHNSQGTTNPVGSLSPLIGGFHDLIGNVWEWTKDPIYYDSELEPLQTAPHLCFGGSWRDDDIDMDNLITNYPLDFRHEHLGFRLVKEIGNSVEKE